MRALAVDAGAKFAECEPIEFVYDDNCDRIFPGYERGRYQPIFDAYVSMLKDNITNYLRFTEERTV